MKYKNFIFDIDNTITESRTRIQKPMCDALRKLISKGANVVAIGGQGIQSLRPLLKGLPKEVFLMTQCGNVCKYWENNLVERQKDQILQHIASIKYVYPDLFVGKDQNDLIEDRGCQITFSFVGHHAPLEVKKQFDMDRSKRIKILKDHEFISNSCVAKVAGTTCIDYTSKGGEKGDNIRKFLAREGWLPNDCVYFGDAISAEGNDGSLIGVIPNLISVSGPKDTLKIIEKICKKK